jgi:HAD superfamily hydrolase (TIGR01509 family)
MSTIAGRSPLSLGTDRRERLPAAVLFDNDGLLLDTETLWTEAETRLFETRGRSFGIEEKRTMIGRSADLAAERLERLLDAPGEGADLLAELHELAAEAFEGDVVEMEGARELLFALTSARVPLGLVSNSPAPLVTKALNRVGLDGAFACVITPIGSLRAKPTPDLYLEGCRQLGVAPLDSFALEDTPTGVAAARAAGVRVIGVPSLPGVDLGESDLVASSLADPSVWRLLGLSA